MKSKGDYFFSTKNYSEAIKIYSAVPELFEEIILKLIAVNEIDIIKEYLLMKLNNIQENEVNRSKIVLICYWVVELLLEKINILVVK